MDKRFFYNPENGKLLIFNTSHVEKFHNSKGELCLAFDDYIRGIISEGKIYLRVYYPYNDIGDLSFDDLMKKSFALLSLYKDDILTKLNKQGFKGELIFNCTNESLRRDLNIYFV